MTATRPASIRPRLARACLVLALAGALAGCTRTLDMDGTAKVIREGLVEQLELDIASVSCPSEPRPLKAGDSFECTAMVAEGGSITVAVKQQDEAGGIEWEATGSQGVINMRKAEEIVTQGLLEQLGAEATVSCGKAWQVGKVGDTFECSATDADGQSGTVVLTLTQLEGSFSWALK